MVVLLLVFVMCKAITRSDLCDVSMQALIYNSIGVHTYVHHVQLRDDNSALSDGNIARMMSRLGYRDWLKKWFL